jgi:hypothetical protein
VGACNHRRRQKCVAWVLALACLAVGFPKSALAAEPILQSLPPEQQLTLARVFAPTLVFHALEEFFPASSMDSRAGDNPVEGWSSRVSRYRSWSVPERLQRAALAYRVFSRTQNGQLEVVVEYWCYYVYNAFTVRGGWLPYRMPNNHPNDLERLYLVLRPIGQGWQSEAPDEAWARTSFRVHRVVANAHDRSIPPNEYTARDSESIALPVSVLVERGSHAMAPDLNNDGLFTPGIDSSDILKLQWGIRDHGSTWRWYRESFMDRRNASSVRLCGPIAARDPQADCPGYTLYPADDLQRQFQELQLSMEERHEMVGRTPWLVRTFGDIRVEELMVPPDPANGRMLDRMLSRRARAETGFLAGFTTVDHAPTFVAGRRDFWEVRSRHAPDILTEAVALVPSGRQTLFEATVWGSYSLDAITNVLIGYGWFSENGSASPTIGAEVRIGRFRVRPAFRLTDLGFDSRVTTTF